MKEPKPMDLDEWRKMATKLKEEYAGYSELYKHCKEIFGRYFILLTGEMQLGDTVSVEPVWVYEGTPGGRHDKIHLSLDIKTYLLKKDGHLEKFDNTSIIDELTPVILSHVNKEEMIELIIKDTLNDQPPSFLMELKERLFEDKEPKRKISVKKTPRCVELKFGGKRGAPLTMMIRE